MGWISLLHALQWVLNIKPETKTVEISRRQAVERVIAPTVSHETVSELRNELVVMSTQVSLVDWDSVSLEIQHLLCLDYCLRVIFLTKQGALLELKAVAQKDSVLFRKSVIFQDISVSFSSWRPGVDTLSSNWFQLKPRWLTFLGIPGFVVSLVQLERLQSMDRLWEISQVQRCWLTSATYDKFHTLYLLWI